MQHDATRLPQPIAEVRPSRTYVAISLLLLTMSAVWVQTDLYRYSAAPLLLWGQYTYATTWTVKPRFHWLELLCLGWAVYVAVRLGYAYLTYGDEAKGRSEGLYLFPMLFGIMGYALFRLHRVAPDLFLAFFAISLVMLAASTDFALVLTTETRSPLYHSNPIHAAVAAGFILIGATGWLAYCSVAERLTPRRRAISMALAMIVIAYCVLAVIGANSKGVWLALSLVALIASVTAVVTVPARRHRLAVVIGALALVGVAVVLRERLATVALKTIEKLQTVAVDALSSGDPLRSLQAHIDTHSAPASAQIRMELLYNALTVWRDHFWFGAGPIWDDLMERGRYPAGGFTTIHNAFLEIAVRYGLVGLVAVGVIVLECVRMAFVASRRGLIPHVAFHTYAMLVAFYLIACLTNSHSHQAYGEAFVLLSGGFGLSCLFLVRADDARRRAAASASTG